MMDKILSRFVAVATLVILLITSCEKAPTVITGDSPEFSGDMTVLYEGEPFEQEGIKVLAEFNEDKTMLDIKMMRVKFVPAMPVRIDVTILEIPVTEETDGIWSFYGDGITPWAMGGPYDGYRVDELKGTVSDSALEFSLDFYNTRKRQAYPTSYSGNR